MTRALLYAPALLWAAGLVLEAARTQWFLAALCTLMTAVMSATGRAGDQRQLPHSYPKEN